MPRRNSSDDDIDGGSGAVQPLVRTSFTGGNRDGIFDCNNISRNAPHLHFCNEPAGKIQMQSHPMQILGDTDDQSIQQVARKDRRPHQLHSCSIGNDDNIKICSDKQKTKQKKHKHQKKKDKTSRPVQHHEIPKTNKSEKDDKSITTQQPTKSQKHREKGKKKNKINFKPPHDTSLYKTDERKNEKEQPEEKLYQGASGKSTHQGKKQASNWRSRKIFEDSDNEEIESSDDDDDSDMFPGAVAVNHHGPRRGMPRGYASSYVDVENPPELAMVKAELVQEYETERHDIKHVVAVPASNVVQTYWKLLSFFLLLITMACIFALSFALTARDSDAEGKGEHSDSSKNDNGTDKIITAPPSTTIPVVESETLTPGTEGDYLKLREIIGASFDNDEFPASEAQMDALIWLSNTIDQTTSLSVDNNDDINTDRLLDRYLVALLLRETGEARWENNQNLLGSLDLCDWQGIGCASNSRVNSIDLGHNGLAGTLPTELGLLTDLTNMELYSNYLTSKVPSEIGLLTNLEQLRLDDNYLTGSLPNDVQALTNLNHFNVSQNYLTGPFACNSRASNSGSGDSSNNPTFYNGDFEAGIGNAPACWEHSSWNPYQQTSLYWSPNGGFAGTGGVRIRNLDENDSRYYQTVGGLEVGQRYLVSGMIKVNWVQPTSQEWNCGASLSRIKGYDRSECIFSASDWTQVEFTFWADTETDEIGCRLGYYHAIAVGDIECDSISIEKIS